MEEPTDEKQAGHETPEVRRERLGSEVAVGIDEAAAIPKGTIDPVYEAKARVLNRAVSKKCSTWWPVEADMTQGSRHRHGLVPMAVIHCCRFWLGK